MTSTDNRYGRPPSEADIQAYADGTLTPERAAALRDYLSKHPAEARRVAFYDRLNAQIQAAFRATDEPMPQRAGRSLEMRDLDYALQRLPLEQREVVLLVGLEEMGYADVALALNIPIGTVMSRLSRGRERLRALMAGSQPGAKLQVVR